MITSTWRRTARALGASLALAALVAGCSGGTGASGGSALAGLAPADVARHAPDVTRAAGTARIALEMTLTHTGGPLPGTMTMSGTGTYDFGRQIGEAEYTSTGGGIPDTRSETIFTNNVVYERPAGQTRWYEWDFSDLVNRPVGQYDPSQQLDLLRGVSDDVREVGSTTLRDTDVTQYAITIDPTRLAEHSGVVVEGGLTQAALRATGPMPGQVFVDEDGRVRRLEVSMSVSGADLAASPELAGSLPEELAQDPQFAEMLRDNNSESKIAIDYFDFGVPVTAQIPDPSTITDDPTLLFPR
jgi:hypothetical protein